MSGSFRFGPFTVNSRGRTSTRLGKGLSYRGGCVSLIGAAGIGVGLLTAAIAAATRML